jgi:aminotransferase in exopolysaccharide biosynthesis
VIPVSVPDLVGNEARYLQECIDSGFVSSVGPFVAAFEESVARATGARHAVATSSGTTGLHIALVAAAVTPGDLVIIPSYTFIATANAVSHAGAEPWLTDVSPESWTLDPHQLRTALNQQTKRDPEGIMHKQTGKRVAAVMPVYTLGHPADMEAINEVALEFGLPVVADAAAAIGAEYKGRSIGMEAPVSVFSFNGNKTITSGGGGAVVTNDAEKAAKIRHLSTTARVSNDYLHDQVGYNYRMTNLQAAVGVAQLERATDLVMKRQQIARNYENELAALGVRFAPQSEWAVSSRWLSCAILPDGSQRSVAEIVDEFAAQQVQVRPFWRPMHEQPPYSRCLREPTPVTDQLWRRVLTLPSSSSLSSEDQTRVIEATRRVLSS